MNLIDAIFKALKLPVKIIIIVAVFTLILLLLPQSIIDRLSLKDILVSYRQWFSLIFIFSLAFIIVNIIYAIINSIKIYLKRKKEKKEIEEKDRQIDRKLSNLDPKEKAVLREFVIQSSSTLKLPVTDPTVANLLSSHLLENVGQYAQNTLFGFLYNLKLNDYTQSKLTLEMIDLPNKTKLSEKDKIWLQENRPPFIHNLLMFKDVL